MTKYNQEEVINPSTNLRDDSEVNPVVNPVADSVVESGVNQTVRGNRVVGRAGNPVKTICKSCNGHGRNSTDQVYKVCDTCQGTGK